MTAFTFSGLLIVLLALLQLNKSLSPFPTPKEEGKLVEHGLYKFVRHPIYSGIILATISFGLFQGSVWKIVVGIACWVLFYFKSAYEELLLDRRYENYKMYSKRTGRFFPKV